MKIFKYNPLPYLLATIYGYGKGKCTKPRNPIYGLEKVSVLEQIKSGSLYELTAVKGEGIVND